MSAHITLSVESSLTYVCGWRRPKGRSESGGGRAARRKQGTPRKETGGIQGPVPLLIITTSFQRNERAVVSNRRAMANEYAGSARVRNTNESHGTFFLLSLPEPARVTIRVNHGSSPPPPTLQGLLPPLFLRLHGLHPTPMLVGLLLLATQPAQKELDSISHDQPENTSETHAVTPQDRHPYQP